MASTGTPVVFVYGLWLHAGLWGVWVERFREAGYAPTAPPWPGDSARTWRKPCAPGLESARSGDQASR